MAKKQIICTYMFISFQKAAEDSKLPSAGMDVKKPFLNSLSCPEFHHPQFVCLCAPRSQASQHGKIRSFYGTSFETKTKLTPNRTENGLVSARRKKHKTVKKVPQIPEKSSICGFLV